MRGGPLRPIVVVVLPLVVVLAAYVGVGRWRGEVEWQRFQGEAAALEPILEGREPSRPVLWGDAHAGSAWSCYERAGSLLPADYDMGLLERLARREGAALEAARGARDRAGEPDADASADPRTFILDAGEPPELPQPQAALAALHDTLAALREGAHCADPRRPADWTAGFEMRVLRLTNERALSQAAVFSAIVATGQGRDVDAVHVLLDALQLARDRMQSTVLLEQLAGCAGISTASSQTLEWSNLLRHLGPDALAVLRDGLARLDASLPLGSDWLRSETVYLARHLEAPAARDEMFGNLTWCAWRYGFSAQLLIARQGLSRLRLAQDIWMLSQRTDALDSPAIERRWHEFWERSPLAPDPSLTQVEPKLRARLHAIAQVRLLRMATAYALGYEVVTLPDPAGGTLQWSVDASGIATFWTDDDRRVRLTVRR